jgi:hypothetical protein
MRYGVRALACCMLLVQCNILIGITDEQDQALTQIITDFTQSYSAADQQLTQTVSGFFSYLDVQGSRVAQSSLSDSVKNSYLSLIATSSGAVASAYSTNKASLDAKYQTAYATLGTTKDQWTPKVTSSISFTSAQSALNSIVKGVNFQIELSNTSNIVGQQFSSININVVNKLPQESTTTTIMQDQIDQTLGQIITNFILSYSVVDQALTQTVADFFAYVDSRSSVIAQSAITDAEKTTFTDWVETASVAVSQAYNDNKTSLVTKYQKAYDSLITQKNQLAPTITTSVALANAQSQLNGIVSATNFQIEFNNVSQIISKQLSDVVGTGVIALANAQLAAKQLYQQQMFKLWTELQKQVVTYQQIKNDAQAFEIDHVTTKTFKASNFDSLITRLKAVVSSFIGIYGSYNVPINFDDVSNFAVVSAKYLIGLFIDDMNLEQSIATSQMAVLGTRNAGIARLYELCTRILGTKNSQDPNVVSQGYNATVDSVAALFSSDIGVQLVTTYTTQRKTVIQSAVMNALELLLSNTAPTAEQLQYGQALVDVALLGTAAGDTATISQLYTTIATLYVTRSIMILKALLPGNDNTADVNEAAANFKNAATQYAKAGDQDSYNQYTALSTNLLGGLAMLSQAQQSTSSNINNAISYYKQAADYFAKGGDSSDASFATLSWTKLDSKNQVSQAQTLLLQTISSNALVLQTYLQAISDLTIFASMKQSYDAWNSVGAAAVQTIPLYSKAIDDIATIAVSAQLSGDTSYQDIQTNIEQAIVFINTFTMMWDIIKQADSAAQADPTSLDGIDIAESLYEVAINKARKLDELHTKYPQLSTYVPFYVTDIIGNVTSITDLLEQGQVWSYETMVIRHISKIYIDTMAVYGDQLISDVGLYGQKGLSYIVIQYFADADGGRRKYLMNGVETFLTTTIDQFRNFWGNVEYVYFNAQDEEKVAQLFTAVNWKNVSTDPTVYSSAANDQWQNVLRHYKAGVLLGSPDATNLVNASQQGYINTAGEYAAQYLQYVPSDYFPSLAAAMIYYRQYCMYVLNGSPDQQGQFAVIENSAELQQQVYATIETLMEAFFKEGSDLLSKLQDTSLLATATENQKKLVEWKNYFDHALYEQEDILNQFFSDNQQAAYIILSETIDDAGNITCTYMNKVTLKELQVVIPNPDRALAIMYKTLADTAFGKFDYANAATYYQQAWQSYTIAGDVADAQTLFSKYIVSVVRSQAALFASRVVPNDQDSGNVPMRQFYSASVPTLYELSAYSIPLSKNIPQPVDITSTETQALVTEASLNFIDSSLMAKGFSYTDVFDGFNVRSSLPTNISSTVVNTILAQAQTYSADLMARLNNNISRVYFINYNGAIYIVETYRPILATSTPKISSGIPLKVLPYPLFPTAELYLKEAQLYYAPGSSPLVLSDGTMVTLAAADQDVSAVQALYNRLAQAYIQDASDYGLIVDYITTSNTIDTLSTIVGLVDTSTLTSFKTSYQQVLKIQDKTDTSNLISNYRTTYQAIKSYYLDIIFGQLLFGQDYLAQGQSSDAVAFKAQVATMLTDALSKLKPFLFGDPLSDDYYLILKDQTDMVKMALAYAPSQQESLYTYLAQLSLDAANALTKSKKYSSAVSFYLNALKSYQNITGPSSETLFAINQTLILATRSLITAAAVNIAAYQKAKNQGVTVSGKTISFQQLLKDYQNWGSGSVLNYGTTSSDEITVYNDLKTSLLDAIIYLMGASGQLSPLVKNIDASGQSAALDMVATYTKQAQIDVSSAAGITAFLNSDALESLLINGFETVVKNINAGSSEQTNTVSFAAAVNWFNVITQIFTGVYISDYLGGSETSDQWAAFTSALNAEVQDILSPASSYV